MSTQNNKKVKTRVWTWVLLGGMIIGSGVAGVVGWGMTMPIASAVIANGFFTVDTNRKKIQHLEGGIVETINVRDGAFVNAGDVVIRLSDTRAKTSLAIVKLAYLEELAKEARLITEREKRAAITWPVDLTPDVETQDLKRLRDSQLSIFTSRKETLNGEINILKERTEQLAREIEGLEAQKKSAEKQIKLINEELATLKDLLSRGQTTKPRMLALEREAARLEGEHGEFIANIARAHRAMGETKLSILQKHKAFNENVVNELGKVQAKIKDLAERKVASEDVINRLDIRAPVSGKIVNLSVHAADAVIRAGDPIMEIVPSDDHLLVEVQVQPFDVDSITIGQASKVRLSALSHKSTPTLQGVVTYVSPDVIRNRESGASYYLARVKIDEKELKQLSTQDLQPGMPAEVMIQTGERTAMAYLMKPIYESVNRAWREQ